MLIYWTLVEHKYQCISNVKKCFTFIKSPRERERERERDREGGERQREILKFGISLWHIDKHGVVLTARETEREREREREI